MKEQKNPQTEQILNKIQYFISSIIGVSFGIGLIPTLYDNVFNIIMIALTIQIIISLIRVRLLNVFLEIFLVGLGALSLIPLLGYVFRFIGIIFSILEIGTFKNMMVYNQMETKVFKTKPKKRKNPNQQTPKTPASKAKTVKDADFKEKPSKPKPKK